MDKWTNIKSFGNNFLLSIVYTVFILSFAVLFTLSFKPLYYFDIHHLKIEERSGMEEAEIKRNYDALIRYNSFWNSKPLTFPTLAMSENGRIHFEDVKNIFNIVFILCITTLLLGLLGTLNQYRDKDYRFLKYASLLTLILPFTVGVSIAVSWQWTFVAFHELFFRNDYWWFNPTTDPVITILPDTFFLHCALLILSLTLLGSIICQIIYQRQKRKANLSAN
jgi:integral membrane protein (TIGR01906 family)